jgi:hypothetical protein
MMDAENRFRSGDIPYDPDEHFLYKGVMIKIKKLYGCLYQPVLVTRYNGKIELDAIYTTSTEARRVAIGAVMNDLVKDM